MADVAASRPVPTRANPADPAYRWPSELDSGNPRGAATRNSGLGAAQPSTPAWANGGRGDAVGAQAARDFADFAVAASRRYPGVRHWMIWGEPSKARDFSPSCPLGPPADARDSGAARASMRASSTPPTPL